MIDSVKLQRLTREVDALIEEAKLSRDDGDLEGAIGELNDAVQLLQQSGWDQQPSNGMVDGKNKIASYLADCLGMIGGHLRRLNRLDEAEKSFTDGRSFEGDERYGVDSSYNLVNAITLPIEMGDKTASDQRPELIQASKAIERQINFGKRRSDRWAWADRAQCVLLLGDVDEARRIYREFKALADADSLASHVTVLNRLRAALAIKDPAVAAAIEQGIQHLGQDD